jgi:hypothetical protein
MKSTSKILGVLLAGCLMFAAPGCVAIDSADDAEYVEAEWAEELLDNAVESQELGEGAENPEFDALDEDGDPGQDPDDDADDFPDPFNGGSGG